MMYKITDKKERVTTKGKPYISATLTDEQGKEFAGINAFNGEFNVSDTWHGELEQNGNYYNLVTPKQASGASFKQRTIDESMHKKNIAIGQFQDSKEQSIKIASTFSKAVELAIEDHKNPNNLYTLDELIVKWRKWLWTFYSDVTNLPPF